MRKKFLWSFIAILLNVGVALAQNTAVSGKVTDEKGAPLEGAVVSEKSNTKNTVLTSATGNFTIKVKPGASIIISSVGYATKTVNSSGSLAQIALVPVKEDLSEVVVTGTGSATSKKKLAVAVESVTAAKLPAGLSADAGQALVGKIPGAQITSTNGNPGQDVNILLRGINSIQRGTTPMILLDGVQVDITTGGNILKQIDLNSIERIEVVQGAAAGSVYGAQGANGVIQLFTKKGKLGKLNIDFSTSYAVGEMIMGDGYGKSKYHAFKTNANNEVVNSAGNPIQFDEDYGTYLSNVVYNPLDVTNVQNKPYNQNFKYYDHAAMFFQQSVTKNNSLFISGAREKVDFSFSASDNLATTTFRDNGDYRRSNLIANIGFDLAKGLKFRTITQVVRTDDKVLDPTGRTYMYAMNNSRPFANYEFKDPTGSYAAYMGDAVGVNGYNPLYGAQWGSRNQKSLDVIQNFNLNYKVNKFVELDAKYGINYQTRRRVNNILPQDNVLNAEYWQYWLEWYAPFTSYGVPSTGSESGEMNIWDNNSTFQNFIGNAYIKTDFQKDFGWKLPIKTTTVLGFDYRKKEYDSKIYYGVDAPNFSPYNLTNFATQKIRDDYKEAFLTYGYVASQKFEYEDLAGFTGGYRMDYSSAFGQGQDPQAFPRGDAFFRLSSLNFWRNSKLADKVSEVKFRAAYGEAGIQPFAFDRQPTLNTQNISADGVFYFSTENANPKLNVEISKEFEVGTDISFNPFKGNLFSEFNFAFTYWKRTSDNTIYSVDAAPSQGTGSIKDNSYGLRSNGIQASLNINVLKSKDLNWNFQTNFSKQTSEIASITGPPVVLLSNAGSTGYVLQEGLKIGQLFGYRFINAVDAKDEEGNYYIDPSLQANYTVASNGYVVSKATKRPYATTKQYAFGDPNPKFNMSFINDLSWKNIVNFSMQWDWVNGAHLYNQTKEWMYRDGIHQDYAKPITIDGETGAWTAFYRGVYAASGNNATKTYFYEDASFWRLRNLSASVDLAKLFTVKGFSKLQLVFTGRNLVTFTGYTGMDPEVSSGASNSAWDRGVDHNSVPNSKSYQVGLNVSF